MNSLDKLQDGILTTYGDDVSLDSYEMVKVLDHQFGGKGGFRTRRRSKPMPLVAFTVQHICDMATGSGKSLMQHRLFSRLTTQNRSAVPFKALWNTIALNGLWSKMHS